MSSLIAIVLISFYAPYAVQTNVNGYDCQVQITGLRSGSGKCIIYLYRDKKGFPSSAKNAISVTEANIKEGNALAVFKGLAAGEYAISVVHDENANGKMDANFLGIPKEGIGTSNNTKSLMGPPSYSDSKFTVGNTNNTITINIKYL